ncbi:M50 family metallopeptidase [Nakamurella aerolata]|uniref:Site-2 protease family protein n=1 Tax=Nakamurella aerolata TaxID=1656892 RepID=A0A849A6T0_9ACTN|nr:site-2 protease family protein [Nakamurella aerolata]NNG34210.1 site-2 protease family protein [Nakamurella aerolata]
MWMAIGIVLFALGLLFSIAWHELGHLTFAKLFKVRTTQYMVGFGKTLWSKKVGETEYGLKAIPLGGYIRMVGMVPPDRHGRQRITSTALGPAGFFRQMIEDSRSADRAQVQETDDGRQFYQLHPFKRIVIMFAGPFMNLVLAVGLFAIVMTTIGTPQSTTTVQQVSACVVPASAPAAEQNRTDCGRDTWTPARLAGLQAGDRITTFAGQQITSWDQLTELIRAAAGTTVPITVDRAGRSVTTQVPIVRTERPVLDDRGRLAGTVETGFLGVQSQQQYQTASIGSAFTRTGEFIATAARAVVAIPARIPALWEAAFTGEERDPDSPVGVVGAGRLAGDILEADTQAKDKLSLFLTLLAGFNMSLFLLNLLPLLPLDGGHILGAVIEWIRRGWAKLRRAATPPPFDVAKLMPVAYVVALLFIALSALTLVADIVNPVKIF